MKGERMASPIHCPKCHTQITFRAWSKRLPPKSEALGDCRNCGKVQVRFWNGKQASEPYQCRTGDKTESMSARATEKRKAAIIAIYGSFQNFVDTVPLISITKLYKS